MWIVLLACSGNRQSFTTEDTDNSDQETQSCITSIVFENKNFLHFFKQISVCENGLKCSAAKCMFIYHYTLDTT
jgi:hypothetical protein